MTESTHDRLDDSGASDEATRQVLGSVFFADASRDAVDYLEAPARLVELAAATARSMALRSGPFADVVGEVATMIRMAVAIGRGYYEPASRADALDIVAALVYIHSPIDVIPDATPMVGYLDDVAVVGWATSKARPELNAFLAWEQAL